MKTGTMSCLAIGTELTSGQIINRNAAWLSASLAQLGHRTSLHMTVADEKEAITAALNYCKNFEIIFVTGGLGPTSDDFTREVISNWTGLKLEWHQESWTHIQKRLSERGIAVKEIQRQQCYYPQGSTVMENQLGTAHAFRVQHPEFKTWLVCLPGPPRELQQVWNDHLSIWLQAAFKVSNPWITRSWDILGIPESEIASQVEAHLGDGPYEKAYRVHLPYVEFKLSYQQADENQAWITKVDQALNNYLVRRDAQDVSIELLKQIAFLSPKKVQIVDGISKSYLIHRLNGFQEWSKKFPVLYESTGPGNLEQMPTGTAPRDDNELSLSLFFLDAKAPRQRAAARLQWNKKEIEAHFESPYSSELLQERAAQYFTERAMLLWMETLAKMNKG